jgi:hypothetical protein
MAISGLLCLALALSAAAAQAGTVLAALITQQQPPVAPPSNPAGRWRLEGFDRAFLNLVVNGSTLAGAVEQPNGIWPIFDASIEGVTVRFKARNPNQQTTASFEGTIQGNQIQFKRSVEGRGGFGGLVSSRGLLASGGPATFVAVREAGSAAAALPNQTPAPAIEQPSNPGASFKVAGKVTGVPVFLDANNKQRPVRATLMPTNATGQPAATEAVATDGSFSFGAVRVGSYLLYFSTCNGIVDAPCANGGWTSVTVSNQDVLNLAIGFNAP